ncbi:Phosphatidylinositol 3,4,5-trisphosphate 3-phosphatase and dual-specificity protein phosphatase PTEN [Eumeta japonica]|uniref:phosphatidylinositol-3,4,5-trisphosphate 3-phosphatase n=1 Tax=Eumeta variegata TaxID=151549 RepID=A0A4C1WF85_EUMVA|nr:Phosphatidylinositol 3,4,5-trisphosphate 3-phosphatase and dual-specificity protein phosphatase PTEN [Eumeta japonica]
MSEEFSTLMVAGRRAPVDHRLVAIYPFDDHSPPKIELIQSFCVDVHDWLSKDPKNVAAVHCKAGKGRTGQYTVSFVLYCSFTGVAALSSLL